MYWLDFPYAPGLPNGIFSSQKSQFGYILESLGKGNDVKF
jgi:hypothetical protein